MLDCFYLLRKFLILNNLIKNQASKIKHSKSKIKHSKSKIISILFSVKKGEQNITHINAEGGFDEG